VLRNRFCGFSVASSVDACCWYVSRSPSFILACNISASPLLRLLGLDGALGCPSRMEVRRCMSARAGAGVGAMRRVPMRSLISTSPYTGGPHLAIMFARSRATSASRMSALIDGRGRFGALRGVSVRNFAATRYSSRHLRSERVRTRPVIDESVVRRVVWRVRDGRRLLRLEPFSLP